MGLTGTLQRLVTSPGERSAARRYAVAVLCAVIGWIAREGLSPAIGPTAVPFIFFFPAVAAVGWYGGRGPAIFTTVLSAAVALVFYIDPVYHWRIVHAADIVSLGAFLFSSAIIIVAMDELHRGRRKLIQANDSLSTTLAERKRAEEALRESDRKKDQFLAMLSHELRNPLAPIRLAVTMLRKLGPPDAQLQHLRDIIDRQTTQLARLLDDLLDVSRITSDKVTLRKDRVSLRVALSSAIEASRPLIDSMKHELEVRIASDTIDIEADVGRLAQVFSNILNNAAKYTPAGGRITLEAAQEDDVALVHVTDNGIGIAPEQLSRVFEMFLQVDTSLERGQGGLGVGLTLAKSFVEAHGGRIEASSPGLGQGSRFTVRLPVLSTIETRPARPQSLSDANQPPRRILVADDNEDSAKMLEMVLRIRGHDVRVAHDGEAVLDAAAAFHPELAILDIGMPKLNGYEVARRLRAQFGPDIVLIAMTGWGQESDRNQSREAGFDEHLTKPVDALALDRVISRRAHSVA